MMDNLSQPQIQDSGIWVIYSDQEPRTRGATSMQFHTFWCFVLRNPHKDIDNKLLNVAL